MLAGAGLAGFVVCLFIFVILFREFPIGKPDLPTLRDYWVFAFPVMIIVSSNAITENLDKIMIQFFWSSKELGYYVGAARISMVFAFVAIAVGTLLFPTISSFHSKNDMESIRKLTHRTERYLALLFFPIAVILIFFGRPIILILLGDDFHFSGPILAILSCAMILHIISVPYANQIIGTNRVKLSAILGIILMVLNVLLNLLFIPSKLLGIKLFGLGAYGGAIASLIATSVIALLYRYFAYKITMTRINISMLKLSFASGLMAVLVYTFLITFDGQNLLTVFSIVLISLLFYAAALFVLGELSRQDLRYIADLLSLSKMKTYVFQEFVLSGFAKPKKTV